MSLRTKLLRHLGSVERDRQVLVGVLHTNPVNAVPQNPLKALQNLLTRTTSRRASTRVLMGTRSAVQGPRCGNQDDARGPHEMIHIVT